MPKKKGAKQLKKFVAKGGIVAKRKERQKNRWRKEHDPTKPKITEDQLNDDENVEIGTLHDRTDIQPSAQELANLSAAEFLKGGFLKHLNEESEEDDAALYEPDSDDEQQKKTNKNKQKSSKNNKNKVNIEKLTKDDKDFGDSELIDTFQEHQQQLDSLKKRDPKFYAFLKKESSHLLDFDKSSPAANQPSDDDEPEDLDDSEYESEEQQQYNNAQNDDDSDEESDDLSEKPTKSKKKPTHYRDDNLENTPELTEDVINGWIKQAQKQPSVAIFNKFVTAFKSATRVNVPDGERDKLPPPAYVLNSPAAFDTLMSFCLADLIDLLNSILNNLDGGKKNKASKEQLRPPHERKGWKSIKNKFKSYFTTLIRFARNLTDDDVAASVGAHFHDLVPFMFAFPKLAKLSLTAMLNIWSARSPAARVQAFLAISRMAQELPYPFVELCLKGAYLTYARNSKFVTPQSLPNIRFMRNCVVELLGLDFESSYQMAFVYVRQLAIHLRSALTLKSTTSRKNVLNWQYINSLQVWSQMLVAYPKNEELSHLVYPITQIILGVISTAATTRYFPLRFYCIRMLNQIAGAADGDIFINTAALAIEALRCPELMIEQRKQTAGSGRMFGAAAPLKLTKSALQTSYFSNGVLDQVEECVVESINTYAFSIALPDLLVPILSQLRWFKKATPNTPHRRQIAKLIAQLVASAAAVNRARSQVDFGPKQIVKAQAFLRSSNYKNVLQPYATQLKKRSDERERLLLHGRSGTAVEDKLESSSLKRKFNNNDNNNNDDNDDSDSDDDNDDESSSIESSSEQQAPPPRKQAKNNSKPVKKRRKHSDIVVDNSTADVVAPFDPSDWSSDSAASD